MTGASRARPGDRPCTGNEHHAPTIRLALCHAEEEERGRFIQSQRSERGGGGGFIDATRDWEGGGGGGGGLIDCL